MVIGKLGDSIRNSLENIAKAVFVDDKLINQLIKDIQRALLTSDVNVKLVFELTKKIKDRAKDEKPGPGLSKKEQIIQIVYEELVQFLGGEKQDMDIKGKKPAKIMLVGLFGTGKTTTAGKLAKYYSKRGFKTALVGLDVHRPAAMEQLEQIATKLNVSYFINKKEKDPIKIWDEIEPKLKDFDLVIVDTAGRDALSEDLVEEIEKVNERISANEKILVISADIGQAAQRQAQQFHDSCGITGIIISKMDGTAKAGGALSACAVTNAHIKFIGVGEKSSDLESFNPKGFVSRMLGMGDIESLLDKVNVEIDKDMAEDLGKKFLKGEFNLLDLYEQMKTMKKMGSFSKIMDMIPGFSQMKIPKDMLEGQEEKIDVWRYIMDSCTKEELEDPEIIDMYRIERIAKGSGTKEKDIRELLKQYKQGKKMMKMMKGKDPTKMMKNMGGGKGKMPKIPGMGKFKF
jgi:signal recognition particle subunit SRP54